MFASIFSLAVFSLVLIWVGFLYRDRTESADFHMSERKVGTGRIAASTFTLLGGGEFVTLTALTYLFGYSSAMLFAGAVVGFGLIGYLWRRMPERRGGTYSLPDYFRLKLGPGSGLLASVVSVAALSALYLIQLVVGGLLIAFTTGLPYEVCVIGMAAVVCLYVYSGGFNGVLATDVIQAVVMVLVLFGVLAARGAIAGSAGDDLPNLLTFGFGDGLALFLAGFFAVFGGADVWQRLLAAKDQQSAVRGFSLCALGWGAFAALVISLGLAIQAAFPEADPNSAFFLLLESGLPEWLSAMFALLLFSAILSTADTELLAIATIINRELKRRSGEEEVSTKVTRALLLAISVVGSLVAVFFDQLVDIYFVFLYLTMVVGPIGLARVFGRGRDWIAVVGIVGGLAVLGYLAAADLLQVSYYPAFICVPPLLVLLVPAREGEVLDRDTDDAQRG